MFVYVCVIVWVGVGMQEVSTNMACSEKFLVRSAPAPDTVTEVLLGRGGAGERV
jgi:hypothetical protein